MTGPLAAWGARPSADKNPDITPLNVGCDVNGVLTVVGADGTDSDVMTVAADVSALCSAFEADDVSAGRGSEVIVRAACVWVSSAGSSVSCVGRDASVLPVASVGGATFRDVDVDRNLWDVSVPRRDDDLSSSASVPDASSSFDDDLDESSVLALSRSDAGSSSSLLGRADVDLVDCGPDDVAEDPESDDEFADDASEELDSPSSAAAIPGLLAIAAPIPRATANAPTLPMNRP